MQKIGEKTTELFGTFEFYYNDGNIVVKKLKDGKVAEGPVLNKRGVNCVNCYSLDNIKDGQRYEYCALPNDVYEFYVKLESERQKANLKLVYSGSPLGSRTDYYSLNQRVEPEIWNKIKKYFQYITKDDYENDYDEGIYGWNTTTPEPVEKVLGIKEENTVAYRKKVTEEKRKQNDEKMKVRNEILSQISEAFEDAEYPDPKIEAPKEAAKFQPGYEKMYVEGEKIENPEHPENIYGGGQWWIIQENWIWRIQNNGNDGDDWSRNNINTGGAGAIGVRVPYNKKLAEKIRSLMWTNVRSTKGDIIEKKHRTTKYTAEYPAKHPLIEIPILETDEVQHLSTNNKGNIRTNKRALDDHYATVILGNLNICDNKIILPKDVKAWSCKVYGGGIISSVGLKDTEVTVIIHL